jgi:hypothetical protein
MEKKELTEFQSDIPEHLLANVSPQDRYIMEKISILSQATHWLSESQKEQVKALEEIRIQTTKTNGSVIVLKEQAKRAEEVTDFYFALKRLVGNKIFIISATLFTIIFFAYIAPWIAISGKALIPALFKVLLGA